MKKYLLPICAVLTLVLAAVIWPANPFDLTKTTITVPAGSSVPDIQRQLQEKKLLPGLTAFRVTIKLFGLGGMIKAGDYQFSSSDPLPLIVTKLALGDVVPQSEIAVAFPEGTSIYKMGESLKDKGFKDWYAFQALVHEGITAKLREKYWSIFKYVPSESLEGYLFPDTYRVFPEADAAVLAERMVARFNEVIMPVWESSKQDTKMTLHETLTLASIIEKEAQKPEERPIISSVFYNRLKARMPLAADPTVKYALERPSKIVYLDQLSVKSPYNTYKVRGLPPGPICNPGLDSFKAAIYPAKTDYFFFVAKKDGSHIFSKNWQEHQRARTKVQ